MADLIEALAARGIIIDRLRAGEGGSAYVHQGHLAADATDLSAPKDTPVAVKEYKPDVLAIAGQRDRVMQEATLGASLSHDHLVRTYDLVTLTLDGVEKTFLLLEWVEGAPLEDWYRNEPQPVPWATIQSFCLNLIDAVSVLHEHNVLHRDIKPENIMVRTNGPVLMDIGVAEVTGNDTHSLHTALKDFLGTVRYAAPQFLKGEAFATADDVYSLGATFVFLFTGKPIFPDAERKPIIPTLVVQPDAKKFGPLATEIPPAMGLLLGACLHHDRKRRPTLDELRDAITNPTTSGVITRELERQQADAQGYPILKVSNDGKEIFADLGGEEPGVDEIYTVVRRVPAVTVPSLGRSATAEEWIAQVMLKRRKNNVGHFRAHRRIHINTRKPLPSSSAAMQIFNEYATQYAENEEWIETSEVPRDIKAGDIILKRYAD